MSIKQGGNTIAGAVGKYPLNERNISNCITNIPQDIKLELNNGTLTLKAGSKVYVPNGAGVFDEITIANDKTVTPTWLNTSVGVVYYMYAEDRITATDSNYCHSGSTAPTESDGAVWYDTTNNKVKRGVSGSWTDIQKSSLPIAIVKNSSNVVTSIDQVFNGFGYIGSTVFALPGVKGLIPDGRNEDGTLKNIEVTVNNVLTHTGSYNSHPQWVIIYSDSINAWDNVDWIGYNSQENILFNKEGSSSATSGSKISAYVCAFLSADGNQKITAFTPKTAFHAVDYSDTEYIAHQAMPNMSAGVQLSGLDSYQQITEDGWIHITSSGVGIWDDVGVYYSVNGSTPIMQFTCAAFYNNQMFLPVPKNIYIKRYNSKTTQIVFYPCIKG